MTKELCHVIDQLSREKGIEKEILLNALESALLSAARKRYGDRTNVNLTIDSKTCNIDVYETKKIVDKVLDKDLEISNADVKKSFPGSIGKESVDIPLDLQDFGRIAAQTAKQVIFQKVREAERDVIYNEFKGKVGQILSGVVLRKEKNNYYINIGKTEAILSQSETLPGENLRRGDTVRAYIEDVKLTPRGPVILVSRTNPHFIAGLFKMEVPEINEGLVVIKDIVREPGERTKIAVYSTNTSIDPVGACVGQKGIRVQTVTDELGGQEKIDVIQWNKDERLFLVAALSPAKITEVQLDVAAKKAKVFVDEEQAPLAIGSRGVNVNLASRLTEYNIDIVQNLKKTSEKQEDQPTAEVEEVKKEKEQKTVN